MTTPPPPTPGASRVEIAIPAHLRTLAGVGSPVSVVVTGTVTMRSVLDALEEAHPVLRGTVREHGTHERRAFMRYFACGEDVSLASQDAPLPAAIAEGREAVRIVGAIAGG